MRIGIIGAGAVGSIVGGLLTRAGRDVTLVDQWPEHVEAMKAGGLRLSGSCGEHLIPVRALHIHELQRVRRFNLRIVFRPGLFIQQKAQPRARVQPEVVLAFRAHLPVGFQILFPNDLPAALTLDPETFRAEARPLFRF